MTVKQNKLIGLFFMTALCLAGGCRHRSTIKSSQDFAVDKVYERGPLTVHVRVDREELNLAQTLQLQLTTTADPNIRVTMPKIDKVLTQFGIRDWNHLPDRLESDQKLTQTLQYELEPFLSGDYKIPAFSFRFFDANDPNNAHELTTEEIPIKVTSLLGKDRNDLTIGDIENVVEIPRRPIPGWIWVASGSGLILVLAMVLFFVYRRHGEIVERRVFKPAHEVAYARLQALIAEDLIAAGRLKEFYQRINAILRHYIEDRFALRAPERTTEEFLAELRETHHLNDTDKASLGRFLEYCDLVKFAKHQPGEAEIQHTFDLVKQFIETTRVDENQVDVTDQVVPASTSIQEGQDA